jgi:hybrid cluster-associated redox disulfide protein
MKNKITKNTTIKKILKMKNGEEILMKYNLPCLSCPMAALEIDKLKIGQVAEMYGIDADKLIKELNKNQDK